MDESREVSDEEFVDIERAAFEWWGLDPESLDAVEAYHALRVLRLKAERPIPSFDDFVIAWKKRKQ